ncbi:class I SAM-dependent methyltransferase [bacterium SCSIO 12741]|nr:class I SAM-dependent methyltransferase [bacterium SCSIO 12741]
MNIHLFRIKQLVKKMIGRQATSPKDFLLEALPKGSVGAEIGTWKGAFADRMLTIVEPSKLFLIDPYQYIESYENAWYGKPIGSQSNMDEIYDFVAARFAGPITKGQVEMLRMTSDKALEKFENESLDWVYIDGDHSYEFVKRDLDHFYAKVKVGGWITGDDYQDGNWWSDGVRRAVNEFVEEKGELLELQEIKENQFRIKKIG